MNIDLVGKEPPFYVATDGSLKYVYPYGIGSGLPEGYEMPSRVTLTR